MAWSSALGGQVIASVRRPQGPQTHNLHYAGTRGNVQLKLHIVEQ